MNRKDISNSVWRRVNRFEHSMHCWENDVEAVAAVNADIYELYSYHPCPLNCEEYNIGLDFIEKEAQQRRVKKLKKRMRELLKRQDELLKHTPDRNSTEPELVMIAIVSCREQLLYKRHLA